MMDREHIQKLLGGYATGTLTPEEQQLLFEAALTDQELFDALAREQSLRDLLRDPAARAQLLASMDDRPLPWYRRYWQPLAMAAAAAVLLGGGVYVVREKSPSATPMLVAEVRQEPPAAAVAPEIPATPPPVLALRRTDEALKKAVAPAPPPAAKTEALAVAADTARRELAVPAASPVVAAPAPAEPLTGLDGRFQAGFLEAGSKKIPLQNAQALFYAQGLQNTFAVQDAPAAAQAKDLAARAAHLGVKWTVLRQRDGGDFVEVEPDQLQVGDSVKLKLIPNDDGFLSVWEGTTAVLKPTRAERLKEVETSVLTGSQTGQRTLTLQFTRTAPAQNGIVRAVAEQQSATDAREHSTYVLTANTGSVLPISVRIPLTFK